MMCPENSWTHISYHHFFVSWQHFSRWHLHIHHMHLNRWCIRRFTSSLRAGPRFPSFDLFQKSDIQKKHNWLVVSNSFLFSPRTLGYLGSPILMSIFFRWGWFNHQLLGDKNPPGGLIRILHDSPKVGPSDFALLRVVNEGCRTPVPWSQVIEKKDYDTVDVSEIRGVNHRLDV